MNTCLVTAGRAPRKHKRSISDLYTPPAPRDLIRLDSLGARGRLKAQRFITAGEIETCRRNGILYASRAELADWEVIDFGAAVTTAGKFLGDGCF